MGIEITESRDQAGFLGCAAVSISDAAECGAGPPRALFSKSMLLPQRQETRQRAWSARACFITQIRGRGANARAQSFLDGFAIVPGHENARGERVAGPRRPFDVAR